jgi:hypothetical protein
MGVSGSGVDVSFVCGNGPYEISANGSIKVAFALIGGDNLQDIRTTANLAQQKYNMMNGNPLDEEITDFTMEVYPNPIYTSVSGTSIVRFEIPEGGTVSLELYNLAGQKLRTFIKQQPYNRGRHYLQYDYSDGLFADLPTGVYFYRLRYNNEYKSSKIKISR